MKNIVDTKVVLIPDAIVPNLLELMRYIIKGVFMLNKLGSGKPFFVGPCVKNPEAVALRHRIVNRLADGMGRDRRRRFFLSKLKISMRDITREVLVEQIQILKSFAVVETPSHGSVCLERELTQEAITYLRTKCNFKEDVDIARLVQLNGSLQG